MYGGQEAGNAALWAGSDYTAYRNEGLSREERAALGGVMNKSQTNLQDIFLNQVRKENVPVTIYLITGVQLKGHVRGFDAFTVVLDSPGKPTQLVYKHALASVVPARPVNFRIDSGVQSAAAAPAPAPEAAQPEEVAVEATA